MHDRCIQEFSSWCEQAGCRFIRCAVPWSTDRRTRDMVLLNFRQIIFAYIYKKKAVIYKTVLVQDWWDRSTHPQVQAARRRHVRSLGKRQRDRVWLLRAAKLAAVRHYVDAYVSFENFPANTSTSECLDRRAWEGARVYRESVHVWCPTVRQILKKQHLCRQCILPCEINTIPRLP